MCSDVGSQERAVAEPGSYGIGAVPLMVVITAAIQVWHSIFELVACRE